MNTIEKNKKFLKKLDILLTKKRINKTTFLKELGYSKNAYSEWSSGFTKSYMNKIDEIADYFNVSIDYLLDRTMQDLKPDQYLLLSSYNTCDNKAKEEILNYVSYQLEISNKRNSEEVNHGKTDEK